ncbi:phosphatase PAP2 family protein [Vibrio alginolyticus]|nr:phosphatase PAP2 family protein [Vibrio alginolyticus]
MEQESKYQLSLNWQERIYFELSTIKQELLKDRYFYSYCIIASLIIYLLSVYLDLPISYSFTTYLETLGIALYVTGVLWCIYYYFFLILKKEKKPTLCFLKKIKSFIFPIGYFTSIITTTLAINIIFSNHTFLKSLIPIVNPFYLDSTLSQIDKYLHLGFSPWELTHELFSNPWSSLIINVAYNFWFIYMWIVLIYFTLNKKNQLLRQQFFITFALAWMVIGIIFATFLSSAGPCFMELVTGDNQYAPLLNRLVEQNKYLNESGAGQLWAIETQSYLWLEYTTGNNNIGSGISAMPSMHVSISVLLALSIYKLNRVLGYLAYVFAVIIQIGSVHLGWHYAVDGYLSIILTVTLWKLVGYIVFRNDTSNSNRQIIY